MTIQTSTQVNFPPTGNAPKYAVGQTVNYVNGQPCIYTGEIKEVRPMRGSFEYTIICDEAGQKLWDMGFAVGSCIMESQIKD